VIRGVAVAVVAIGTGALAGGAGLRGAEKQVVARHFTPKDQQIARYAYVPFDVPAGTTNVQVTYKYDRADGANVVDLGLYEPGPLTAGTAAFRGWSGGARDTIKVGVDAATPGYWPGPIPAGRWNVGLGLYKVGTAGVDVEVEIETSSGTAGATPGLADRARGPLRTGPAWYAGVLHAHTTHSDGELSPQQLADKARAEKLDFIAITDHNNTTHQLDAIDAPGLLIVDGEEVTTPGGHFNVWGLGGARKYVDFRILPGDPSVASVIEATHRQGALVAINHPVADCLACSWTHAIPSELDAIEIANGTATARQQAMTIWDTLLRQGRRVTAVGESDWHRGAAPLSTPSVKVWADELSTPAILDGIRRGRVAVVASGALPPPQLAVRAGGRTARIGDDLIVTPRSEIEIHVEAPGPAYDDARVDLVWDGEPIAIAPIAAGAAEFKRFTGVPGYLRVHVSRPDGTPLAVTNPVFVKIARAEQ
jgi:PHP domain-containing protein